MLSTRLRHSLATAVGLAGAVSCGSGGSTNELSASTGSEPAGVGSGGSAGVGAAGQGAGGAGTGGRPSTSATTGTVGSGGSGGTVGSGGAAPAIKTIFIILMENQPWSNIQGNSDAPYINSLLGQGSYTNDYHNPMMNHPSETNYIWLEAGSNLNIVNDDAPSLNHQATTDHLVSLLDKANVSWKTYQDGIDGTKCPLANDSTNDYAVRHTPMVFFDDVTNNGDPNSQHCIDHVRPYEELELDLAGDTVARYNFITPNLCHDMHGFSNHCFLAHVSSGDDWLATEVPKILASQAYQDGGALFITWDECTNSIGLSCEDPIGMIVLSPFAKGGGYSNNIKYDHSSTLRTFQEILGVTPFIRAASAATDLSDLFQTFP